jgi:hypothetical protein
LEVEVGDASKAEPEITNYQRLTPESPTAGQRWTSATRLDTPENTVAKTCPALGTRVSTATVIASPGRENEPDSANIESMGLSQAPVTLENSSTTSGSSYDSTGKIKHQNEETANFGLWKKSETGVPVPENSGATDKELDIEIFKPGLWRKPVVQQENHGLWSPNTKTSTSLDTQLIPPAGSDKPVSSTSTKTTRCHPDTNGANLALRLPVTPLRSLIKSAPIKSEMTSRHRPKSPPFLQEFEPALLLKITPSPAKSVAAEALGTRIGRMKRQQSPNEDDVIFIKRIRKTPPNTFTTSTVNQTNRTSATCTESTIQPVNQPHVGTREMRSESTAAPNLSSSTKTHLASAVYQPRSRIPHGWRR